MALCSVPKAYPRDGSTVLETEDNQSVSIDGLKTRRGMRTKIESTSPEDGFDEKDSLPFWSKSVWCSCSDELSSTSGEVG